MLRFGGLWLLGVVVPGPRGSCVGTERWVSPDRGVVGTSQVALFKAQYQGYPRSDYDLEVG